MEVAEINVSATLWDGMLRRNNLWKKTAFSPGWCEVAARWCRRFAGVVHEGGGRRPSSLRFHRYAESAEKLGVIRGTHRDRDGRKKTARSFARLESTEVVEETDSTIYHLLRRNKFGSITLQQHAGFVAWRPQ